jgi:predicted ribosome quality control (RQC) complex YloA/Tae2 family protein
MLDDFIDPIDVARAAKQRTYYYNNREKELARMRKWQANNIETVRRIKRESMRRARRTVQPTGEKR